MENDLGFDKETINELLKDFFAKLKDNLNDIQTAVNNNEFEQVYQKGHSLKGAASSLCIDKLAQLFEQLENKGRNQRPQSRGRNA